MTDPIVFDTVTEIEKDDGGQALMLRVEGADDQLSISISSWSDKSEHPTLQSLIGKKLRITVDVLDEEPSYEGLAVEQMSQGQIALAIWHIEERREKLTRDLSRLRKDPTSVTPDEARSLDGGYKRLREMSEQMDTLRRELIRRD